MAFKRYIPQLKTKNIKKSVADIVTLFVVD